MADIGLRWTFMVRSADLKNGSRVDAVILDAFSLGVQGLDIARHVAALGLPVVVCFGGSMGRIAAKAARLQTLLKPFGEDELHRALDALMNGARPPVPSREEPPAIPARP